MTTVNLFAFKEATASGAGASIQSTWPERKAAIRVFASGIGISTIRSSFGTRALSQYSLFGTSSARSRGAKLASFQGPVPDGVLATASQLFPSFSQFAGEDIRIQANWKGSVASGVLVVISSVDGSIARYAATAGMRERPCADCRWSNCGLC